MTLIARSVLYTKTCLSAGLRLDRGELTALSPHLIASLRGWNAGRKRRGKGGEEGKGEGGRREGKRMGRKLTVIEISYFRSCL